MNRLDYFVSERRRLVENYNEKLSNLPLALPQEHKNVYSSWHLYVICLLEGYNRKTVFLKLRDKGIGVNVHYIPVHTHPYYQDLGFDKYAYPNSLAYYMSAITLPLYPDLTQDQQDYVCKSLAESLQNA
jgi:dTDP-4-amino-4,6-dideoxygalactose transaminase